MESHCVNLNVCYIITSHTLEGNQMNISDHFLRYNVNFIAFKITAFKVTLEMSVSGSGFLLSENVFWLL